MEEMLHMALAANVLNETGHTAPLPFDRFAAPYPKCLPHSDDSFEVSLLPFSDDALDTFLRIEKPAPRGGKGQPHHYHTIGQFYKAIEDMIVQACEERGEDRVFYGERSRQITPDRWYYGGGGDLIEVYDRATALDALREITEQGEGTDATILDSDRVRFEDEDEIAHYFRFEVLLVGRRYRALDTPESGPTGTEIPIDWDAVAPMRPNPRAEHYAGHPAIHAQMLKFNGIYTRLLQTIGRAFGGKPDALRDAVAIMYELRYQAEALMRIPSPLQAGRTVGPSFEWHAEIGRSGG
jgi:hypothetical protein